MQPKTDRKLNEKDFNILKRTIKNASVSRRGRMNNSSFATELPESIGIKLTNKCNLRCRHCYQWNDSGYHKFMVKSEQCQDIDLNLIKKVLNETDQNKSRLYLWGGEPLVYPDFNEVASLLEKNPRETAICTNATLLSEHMDSILKISSNLELLIGLEGFEKENDAIRGKGSFLKVIKEIRELVNLRGKGIFKGKISIHTMINDEMVDKLYDFLLFFEELGVDMVMVCFPWYISEDCSKKMDVFYNENFGFLEYQSFNSNRSWHAFKYKMNCDLVPVLVNELSRINNRVWKMRVRYQPELEFDEIGDFVQGNELTEKNRHKCLALSNRMDINADGSVCACKFFSEFAIGNIKDYSISEIWHSTKYNKMREVLNDRLMPVCSKCSVLHLHGI